MTTNTEFINTIKLLIYKEKPSLLEKVDFEDDNIFLDPLLFAYFNSKKDKINTRKLDRFHPGDLKCAETYGCLCVFCCSVA